MKKIKYIICDLDGTLLNDQKRISEAQAAYIRQLREKTGIRFGFASGRAISSLKPIAKENGLYEACDLYVANNGADIHDGATGEMTEMDMVSLDEMKYLLELFRPYPYINVTFHNPGRFFAVYDTERARGIKELNYYPEMVSPFEQEYKTAPRVTLVFAPERMEEVKKLVAGLKLPETIRFVQSEKDIIDLCHKTVSKAKGIEAYVKRFGDSLENVMAFGDNDNDLEMLRAAGVAVAMKNATERVQKEADYVTEKTNNEDGIMHFLQEHEDWFRSQEEA